MSNLIKKLSQSLVLFVWMISSTYSAFSQLTLQPADVEIKIKGTSSLHDWEMAARSIKGEQEVEIGADQVTFKAITVQVNVNNITSNNKIMDNKAHKALKGDSYPVISFTRNVPVVFNLKNDSFRGTVKGDLSIGGIKKPIEIPISGTYSGNAMVVKGKLEQLNMKDFGIEPPTAMMGTLKTGEMVSIDFKVEFKAVAKTALK